MYIQLLEGGHLFTRPMNSAETQNTTPVQLTQGFPDETQTLGTLSGQVGGPCPEDTLYSLLYSDVPWP